MAYYLNIPEITEAEDIVSFSMGSGDRSFTIVINAGTTANELFQAAAKGTVIPFVVLVTDGPMFALDDVVVSSVLAGGTGGAENYMTFTLDAAEVRMA